MLAKGEERNTAFAFLVLFLLYILVSIISEVLFPAGLGMKPDDYDYGDPYENAPRSQLREPSRHLGVAAAELLNMPPLPWPRPRVWVTG